MNELAKVLTPENRLEVLPRFFGLSRREAEAVAVSLRPAEVPPTREIITAIRPAAPSGHDGPGRAPRRLARAGRATGSPG